MLGCGLGEGSRGAGGGGPAGNKGSVHTTRSDSGSEHLLGPRTAARVGGGGRRCRHAKPPPQLPEHVGPRDKGRPHGSLVTADPRDPGLGLPGHSLATSWTPAQCPRTRVCVLVRARVFPPLEQDRF